MGLVSVSKLIASQLNQNAKMLGCVFEGVEDRDLDFRPVPTALSFREHLHHLCAACEAIVAHRTAQNYDWDAFKPSGEILADLQRQFLALRARAIPAMEDITPPIAELLTDYLVLHEAYHVGQLALTRKCLDPDWDSLALYE